MKPESKTQTKLDTLESNFTEYPTSIIEINDYFDYYDKATDELEALLVGADENNSQKINKSIEELKELATHNENNKQEILNKLESLGLTLADYHDFVELADLRSEARSYDTVLYGVVVGVVETLWILIL